MSEKTHHTTYLAAGTVICASTDDASGQGVYEAQEFCRFHKFERDDVKVTRKDGSVIVRALRPVQMRVLVLQEGSFAEHLEKEGKPHGN